MNIYPIIAPISVGIGIFLGYFLMKYIAKRMGKPFPGIGELMFDLGYIVQGSDISMNANIRRLKKRGIKIYNSH